MKPGMKIKFLRINSGMTQGELAEKIGLTQAIMSRIESDKRDPTIRELQEMSKIFKVELSTLVADNDSLDIWYRRGDLGAVAERGGNLGEPREASVAVPIFDIEAGYTISFDDGGYPAGHSGKHQLLAPGDVTGENFFGCDLHGDSMQHSGEPSFKEGDRLFFDPGGEVRHGGFAFVRTAGDAATFKQVFFDTEMTVRLHPLNSRYADAVLSRGDIIAMWPLVSRIQRFK